MELTPIFRIEKFLDAIINSTTPPEPVFRVEYFLAKIAGADVVTPEPLFRIEKYLAKILGEDVEIPEPMFRTEFWLAKKCGEDVETPDPAFRVEYWLEEWVNGSAPTYETITGRIVSFLSQRIAPLKIEATLTPIQDLHGYDAPWPAGGGKNLADSSYGWTISESGVIQASSSYVTSIAKVEEGVTYAHSYGGAAHGMAVYAFFTSLPEVGSVSYNNSRSLNSATTFTAPITGYLVCRDPSGSTNVQIEKGSSVTSFQPYSNECPISGHTGAEVYHTGEFLRAGDYTGDGFVSGSYLTNTGSTTANASFNVSGFIPVSNNTPIFVNIGIDLNAPSICYYDSSKTFISGEKYVHRRTFTSTTPANCAYIRMSVETSHTTDIGLYNYYATLPLSWSSQGTVYGGQLTVNEDGTGSVVSDRAMVVYDGSEDETWSISSAWGKTNTAVFYTSALSDAYFPDWTDYRGYITNLFLNATRNWIYNNDSECCGFSGTAITNPTPTVRISKTLASDVTGFRAFLQSNPLQFCYELKTPVTIQLSPGQVEALQGQNVVWVDDSGEIKVTFRSN